MSPFPLFVIRTFQAAILVAGVGCLAYGGSRLYDELRFLGSSVRVTGAVVALREQRVTQHGGSFGPSDSRSRGAESKSVTSVYPTVRYRSPVDGRLHRCESAIDTGRVALGSAITVRASTRDADDARLPSFVRRFLVPALLVLGGLLGTALPVLLWHVVDDDGTGVSLFRSFTPAMAAVCVALVAAAVGVSWRFPLARPTELYLLATDSTRLAWAMREAAPRPGQLLGAAERLVVRLPRVGAGAATSAVITAIEDGRHEDLRRYLAAHRDPAIRFPLALGEVGYFRTAASRGDAAAIRILADGGLDPRRERGLAGDAVAGGRVDVVRQLAGLGVAPADADEARELVASVLADDDDAMLAAVTELGWVEPATRLDGGRWGAGDGPSLLEVALLRGLPAASRALELRGGVTREPLLALAVAGDLDEMRAVAPEHEWRDARPFGIPLLSVAARAGKLDVVRRLVRLGADPGALATIDPRAPARTALDEAVRRGHLDVVRFLAALPAAKSWLDVPDRPAPVAVAAEHGRWDLVRTLVDAGASPNVSYTDPAVHLLPEATPLHRAAWDGNVEMVRYLLAHGADPRARARDLLLPIELARDDAVHAALVGASGEP